MDILNMIQLGPEEKKAMTDAVEYARENPITDTEMKSSNYGETHNEKTPNAFSLGPLHLCFTIEEIDREWKKHLVITITPYQGLPDGVINHDAAVNLAYRFFGYRFDGPSEIFINYISKDQGILGMHLYEPV